MKHHYWRWLVLAAFLFGCTSGWTAETNSPAPVASRQEDSSSSLSVGASTKRAAWQKRLTLGPGDVLNLAMFINDALEQERDNVVIGPDGRINYLQVLDVMAAGLTVDELRAKLDGQLGKFYRSPRTVVIPVSMQSKKYFVLGAVVNKGVFTFERPLTVIEAIGRAGGLQTGVFERSTVELADLRQSFLVRNGKRLPVNFEKLFQEGDLTQNVALEPNDYLYFASASANEVYVFGEVLAPGTLNYGSRMTTIGAISQRGGFTTKAFRNKVLVVRGSLNRPETFVVDTVAILEGKAPDFKLQPRDIVYVSQKPWQKAEDLLDTAVTAFVQGAVITFTGVHAGPLITEPIFK